MLLYDIYVWNEKTHAIENALSHHGQNHNYAEAMLIHSLLKMSFHVPNNICKQCALMREHFITNSENIYFNHYSGNHSLCHSVHHLVFRMEHNVWETESVLVLL
jgi:hypothetical protein